MPRERRRRFRGTLFVTTREEHERLQVAVTRLPAPDPRRPVNLDDHADAVASFVRALAVSEVVVVGHSMGAQVAVSLAHRHPGLVSRFVLVGPTMEPSRRTAFQAIGRLLIDGTREPPTVNGIVFSDYVFRAGPAYTIRQLPLVLEDALEERVAGLDAPVLVIRGDRDPIVSGEWVRELARRAAAPFVEVPGPHVVQYTNPDAVAEAIVERRKPPARVGRRA